MKCKWMLIGLGLLALVAALVSCQGKPLATPTPTPASPPPTDTPAPARITPGEQAMPSPPHDTGALLRIALLGPMSGTLNATGLSMRSGAELALEEWNARGGVLGMRVEAVVADTMCEKDNAARAAEKVITQDRVNFIIGDYCSTASQAILRIATRTRVLQISPGSIKTILWGEVVSEPTYFFRVCLAHPYAGQAMARFAVSKLNAKTAAMLTEEPSSHYFDLIADQFRRAFQESGGQIVAWESFGLRTTIFHGILADLAAADPDVVFLPLVVEPANLIASQAKDLAIQFVFLGSDSWDQPDLDLAAFEGSYFAVQYTNQNPSALTQRWVRAYTAKYGTEPDGMAALTFDAVNLLLTAIERAQSDDPGRVSGIIESSTFEGVSGTMTFNRDHDVIKAIPIIAVKGGRLAFETTVTP